MGLSLAYVPSITLGVIQTRYAYAFWECKAWTLVGMCTAEFGGLCSRDFNAQLIPEDLLNVSSTATHLVCSIRKIDLEDGAAWPHDEVHLLCDKILFCHVNELSTVRGDNPGRNSVQATNM